VHAGQFDLHRLPPQFTFAGVAAFTTVTKRNGRT
jgi:hypothetical protein